jgi:hypothetical protein
MSRIAATLFDATFKFFAGAVENKNLVACLQAQNVAQMTRLVSCEGHACRA